MNVNNSIRLSDGRNLGYAQYGDLKGKPVFYFHGWPGSRLLTSEITQVAKKLRLNIISVERPGYGLSDFKKNRELLDWPDDIIEVADKLKIDKFAVLGLSGGGPYAAACAYKIPHRVTIAGIVVGLGPARFKGAFQGVRLINKIGRKGYRRSHLLTKLTAAICLAEGKIASKRFDLTYLARQSNHRLFSDEFEREMQQHRTQAFRQGVKGPALDLRIYASDWGFRLSSIKTKVLLWYGEADRHVSLNMGLYYAAQIANSKLTIYANEAHLTVFKKHSEEILKTLMK